MDAFCNVETDIMFWTIAFRLRGYFHKGNKGDVIKGGGILENSDY